MKLLILTQYFPPETGAPQNRLFELAVRLKKLGVEIEVLTAMPNYPKMEIFEGYKDKEFVKEEMAGMTVYRTSIFVSQSKGVVARLRNYFSFVWSSARASAKLKKSYDFLMCESPPLFLGYSAMYLARKKKAKLIFNVSDLWPESAEKLGVVTNKAMLGMAYRLEAKLYRKSALVTGQTQGICEDIHRRFPTVKTFWLPNGADISFYDPDRHQSGTWRRDNHFSENDFILLYAGIIGIAQGLDVIIEAARILKDRPEIRFVLLGAGPEKSRLVSLAQSYQLTNVSFLDAVSKSEMPAILKSVNAAVIPLRKLDLFLGAIPSKIFEALAMKLPVILGVDGEARKLFVEQGRCAMFVEPENSQSLSDAVVTLTNDPEMCKRLGDRGREYVNTQFNRDKIALRFYDELTKAT